MRVLHLIKTADGAQWAVLQVRELIKRGIEVHVALPSPHGRLVPKWRETGAHLHFVSVDFPVRAPWRFRAVKGAARELVRRVKPDVIHSHFVGTTLVMRSALGRRHSTPCLFQVPGPLHLEHRLYRTWEISSAGPTDAWIASSRYIQDLYHRHGVASERTFLSYYGTEVHRFAAMGRGKLRKQLRLPPEALLVGNVSYMYPPKVYLGQSIGLKRHELLLAALARAAQNEPRLNGVLIGGAWGKATRYERKLRRMAASLSPRLYLPGFLPAEMIERVWADFDLAVHVPLSENCGGVVEPQAAAVPVLAGRVGGLPEVVIDGWTGKTIREPTAETLAESIRNALADLPRRRVWARNGQRLVREMFDVHRTANEVIAIYQHVLDPHRPRPVQFDSTQFVQHDAWRAA